MQINIDSPESSALMTQVQRGIVLAEAWDIADHETAALATQEVQTIAGRLKALEEKRTGIVKPLNEALGNINALFRAPREFLEGQKKLLGDKVANWNMAERRRIEEEQRKRDEEARTERDRLAREAAEREAQSRAEAQRIADEAKKAQEAGDAGKAAELALQAQQTAAAGRQDAIALQSQAAAVVSAPVIEMPQVKGVVARQTWKARVTDKQALIAHIAQHPEFLELVEVSQSALNQLAKAQKQNMKLPGAEAYIETGSAVRAA